MNLIKIEKKTRRRRRFLLFLGCILIFTFALPVFAADGDQYIKFYENNASILETNGIIMSALHSVGWLIVKALVKLGEATQGIYDTAFGFIDLTTISSVNTFIMKFKPVFVALTAVSLVYLGMMLIMNHEKKPNVAINICIAILCVSCSTFMFSTLNGLTHSFKHDMDNLKFNGNDKAVYAIVNDNMYDVLKLYTKKGTNLMPKDYDSVSAGITEKNFDTVDINEVINCDNAKLGLQSPNPFTYRIIGHDTNGKAMTTKNDNGWGINSGDDADFGNEFYYRYNFQYMPGYIELCSLIVIYVAMAYKVFRVAFELVVARLLAYLYSAELSGGEKIKKILVFIRDSYILLGVSLVCIKLYQIFSALIKSVAGNGLVAAIFSLFLAFVVIDGPNLVERLLGMDVGLKSSTARFLAAWGTVRGTARSASHALMGNSANGIGGKLRSEGAIKTAGKKLGVIDDNPKNNMETASKNKDGSGASASGVTAASAARAEQGAFAGQDANKDGEGVVSAATFANADAGDSAVHPDQGDTRNSKHTSMSDTFEPKKTGRTNRNTSMPERKTQSKSSYFSDQNKQNANKGNKGKKKGE